MKKLIVILLAIGLTLSLISIAAGEEKSISGVVKSVHFSPADSSKNPWVIVIFADGRVKIFSENDFAHEIKADRFYTIYYENDKITRVGQRGE